MNRSNSNNTNKDSQTNRGSSDPNASILSTDSLLSTNTTSSTINPFLAANTPRKDYSAALSILQSRYGTGGHVVPSPKTNPSNKLRDTITQTAGTMALPQGGSQATLVSTPSISSSTATSSTASNTQSSGTTQSSERKGRIGGIRSLFKGKGNSHFPSTYKRLEN